MIVPPSLFIFEEQQQKYFLFGLNGMNGGQTPDIAVVVIQFEFFLSH